MKIETVIKHLEVWADTTATWTVIIKKKSGSPNVIAQLQKINYYDHEDQIEPTKQLKKLKV